MQRQGAQKRQKERARQEKQREKDASKVERRKDNKNPRDGAAPGEDPDIAGIVPGPQPIEEDS
jgi:hypothetical protein